MKSDVFMCNQIRLHIANGFRKGHVYFLLARVVDTRGDGTGWGMVEHSRFPLNFALVFVTALRYSPIVLVPPYLEE